jgi:hypothetical protein
VDLYIHSPIRLHDIVLNQLSTGTTLPKALLGVCESGLPRVALRPLLLKVGAIVRSILSS